MSDISTAKRVWSSSGMVFAAMMLLMIGLFQFFQGLAAVIRDEWFVVAPNYAYEIDATSWGWIHLIIGTIVALTGLALFTGAEWARGVGMGLALLSAITQFFFIPYYPWWALLIIALDVFVIWALAVAPRTDG